MKRRQPRVDDSKAEAPGHAFTGRAPFFALVAPSSGGRFERQLAILRPCFTSSLQKRNSSDMVARC